MTSSHPHRVDRMADRASLKQKFLKKWIKGLQICKSSKNLTTITERRKFIKLSADIAMASVRDGTTSWSRALIANASCDSENKALVEQISGCSTEIMRKSVAGAYRRLPALSVAKKITSKKILKRSRKIRKRDPLPSRTLPSSIAKRLVKKRTQLLKSLVPGGESMDDVSLIKETLDYIMSLRAQVDVMRCIAHMSEHIDRK